MSEDEITSYEAEREVTGSPEWEIFMQVVDDARKVIDIIRPDELLTQPIGDILATARLMKIDNETPLYRDVVKELRGYIQAGQSPEYIGGILQELEEGHLALEKIANRSGQKIPRIKI